MSPTAIENDIRARMTADGAPPLVTEAFINNRRRWRDGDLGVIPGATLGQLPPFPRLQDLDELAPEGEAAIARTAVIRLIDEGGECETIVTQLAACSKALDKAGFQIIASTLRQCIEDPDETMDPKKLEKLFLMLA